MSSRFHPAAKGFLAIVAAAALVSACDRERRDFGTSMPEAGPTIQTTQLTPGPGGQVPPDSRGAIYEKSAYHVSQGSQLFRWYNCSGCHANGGGGMGPALIDDQWRYGSSIEQIYGTISEGRPNGMPSFRGKATDEQIWELAAYVRSLGGFTPQASSARDEAMRNTPPRNQVTPPKPTGEGIASVAGTAP